MEVQQFKPQEYCSNCLYPSRYAINAPIMENGKRPFWQVTGVNRDGAYLEVLDHNGDIDVPRGNDYIFFGTILTPTEIHGSAIDGYSSGMDNSNTYFMYTSTTPCTWVRFASSKRDKIEVSYELPAGTIFYHNTGAHLNDATEWSDWGEKNNS